MAVIDYLASALVKARTESGEGFKLLELRISQLKISGDGMIGRKLRFSPDAGNGLAYERRQLSRACD
jgi:hypothetical protein